MLHLYVYRQERGHYPFHVGDCAKLVAGCYDLASVSRIVAQKIESTSLL